MHINPVFRKELKLGARSAKLPTLLLIYNGILAFITLLVFYSIIESAKWSGIMNHISILLLYVVIIGIEGTLLAFIVPSLTSGTISGERERQTLDILLSTRMTPLGIITGKLLSSLSTNVLLVISSLPVVSIVFIFGGISLKNIIEIMLYLIFVAVYFGAIGIACSARFKKTVLSTAAAYGSVFGLCIGTAAISVIFELIASLFFSSAAVSCKGIVNLILLFNPAITVISVLIHQLGAPATAINAFHEYMNVSLILSSHWIGISIIVQILCMIACIWLAQKSLKPKKH